MFCIKKCMLLLIKVLFLLQLPSGYKNLDLLILHASDIRGRFDEIKISNDGFCGPKVKKLGQCYGGVSRMAAAIEDYRQAHQAGKGPKPLFFYSGGIFTGTVWFRIHKSNISADFMNLLKPDVVALGHNDFDYGVKELGVHINKLGMDVVCANLQTNGIPEIQKLKESILLNVDGTLIGVIGFTPLSVRHMLVNEFLRMNDEVEAVKEESTRLKQKGAKIIIALGSVGEYSIIQRMAKEASLVNIIIGGGNGELLWNLDREAPPETKRPIGPYPDVINNVLILQTLGFAKYLGQLSITLEENGKISSFKGQPIYLSNDMAKDEKAEALLKKYEPDVLTAARTNLSFTKIHLLGARGVCRMQECNFGNLLTDAFIEYVTDRYTTNHWTHAPIALLNGGFITSDITPFDNDGNVTLADLYDACPFDTQVVSFSLTGEFLMKTLEFSASQLNTGAFLQVSGLHLSIDRRKKLDKQVTAKARCLECSVPKYELIKEDRTYKILTIDYIIRGGDRHEIIEKNQFNPQNVGLTFDVFKWYFSKYSRLYAQEEGRIRSIENTTAFSTKGPSASAWFIIISCVFEKLCYIFL